MRWWLSLIVVTTVVVCASVVRGADTNTVSTVVTDKAPPTASAPSVVINNNDVCRSGMSVGAQTGFLGIATGHTITDKNCERIKLARSLYFMGMKVAAVSLLCQDRRVFDAMMMSATPCPYKGKIGKDAQLAWEKNKKEAPADNKTFKNEEVPEDQYKDNE